MISDYTERVQRLQRGSCTSKLMINVVNYIRYHISEPITVEKMAKALFMSRPISPENSRKKLAKV